MIIKLVWAGRPHFLIIGLALFVFGATWAVITGAPFSLPRLMFGALVVLLAQLSVSYSNEYFDMEVDQHGNATPFSGGSGILVGDPGLRQTVRWIALGLMAASLLLGVVFLLKYSYPPWMMLFVIIGNMAGWFYSAPPLRFSARGLGEIVYIFILGFLVPSMGYLTLSGSHMHEAIFFLLPFCLYSLASILTVELPDLEVDRLGNKKTWVVRRGRQFCYRLIGLLFLAGTIYFFLFPLFYIEKFPLDFRILGLLSLIPLGAGLIGFLVHPLDRVSVTRIATGTIISLLVFMLLADIYLIYLSM